VRNDGTITRRSALAAAALALVVPAVGSCGRGRSEEEPGGSGAAGRSGRAPAVTTAEDGTQLVRLTVADDYVFLPDTFAVVPGPVQVTVTSEATQLTHNFVFSKGKGPASITEQIPYLAPGDSQSIDFTVTAPGDYQFECSFHVALGQIGTMTATN
jgi:plastocyanin